LVTITSADNPRIKAIALLKKARERRQSGRFLIEGEREVSRAIVAGITIDTLVICREYLGDGALPETTAEILEVGPAPMRRIAMREHPPGVVAVAAQFDTSLSHLEPGSEPLVLIAETVEKPGNLGAMLRTCDAAGADAFIVANPATDIFNPNVVRASQGALFSVPVAVATTGDVIEWCHNHSVAVLGGYPEAADDMWQTPVGGGTAILVGAEDVGISAAWDGVAVRTRIPMAGAADSLNASVSAALLLYEVRRRRSS
jgi:RNA methyltransferase, TrmH family